MAAGALLNQGDRTKLPLKGGIMQGIINMANNAIKGLPKAKNPDEPITKGQYDADIHIVYASVLNDLYNTKRLHRREYSDGSVEYTSNTISIGGSQNDLKGYALSAFNAGYDGVINVKLYQGADTPGTYCTAQIVINDSRMNIVVWGYQSEIWRISYNREDGWTRWFTFTGTPIG